MAKKAEMKRDAGKRKAGGGAANRGHKKGQGALKAGSAFKFSSASSKAGRTAPSGETRVREKGSNYRSEGTIKRLEMYKKKAPNKHKLKEQPKGPARIQPDRRWFGNTRVISQDKMQAFRQTVAKGVQDPYSIVLKSSKLPMSLLKETEGKTSRMDLLSIQPYTDVFSKKKQQKRVKLGSYDLESYVGAIDTRNEGYDSKKDGQLAMDMATGHANEVGEVIWKDKHRGEEIFNKGTSRRIWGELWKVVDASDVICFILDARDPMGTRCLHLEREIRKQRAHKHVILVLNKVDLVPTWVSRRWIQVLMKDFPTLAFHASITNPFGKNALLNLLRQFSTLMKDKKHVTVGIIGYPNVGKSSVINTLKRKKVCKAAPVPGETRVWQYIALTKRLYLLDCPGIVPATASDWTSDCAKVLKGVVRAERIETPSHYIDEVLTRVKKQYLCQRYKLDLDTEWTDAESFLTVLANKMGKLFKGGDADLDTTARIVLYDWQRGRIPFFTQPPDGDGFVAGGGSSSSSSAAAAPAAEAAAGEAAEAAAEMVAPATEGSVEGSAEGLAAAAVAAADAEDDDGEDADEAEASVKPKAGGGVTVNVKQSFTDLSCSLVFDAEDRQGEEAPAAESAKAKGSGKGPEAKGSGKGPAAKKNVAKKATKKQQDNKRKATEAKAEAAAKTDAKGKKRRRGAKGAAGPEGGPAGPERQSLARPGAVDWGAVVAEFGM